MRILVDTYTKTVVFAVQGRFIAFNGPSGYGIIIAGTKINYWQNIDREVQRERNFLSVNHTSVIPGIPPSK